MAWRVKVWSRGQQTFAFPDPNRHARRQVTVATTYEYVFPAIRGVQAGHEHYVSMCPLRLIPRMFSFDDDELRPELRAQRSLNRARVPEIARYMLTNPKNYCFSA